MKIVTLIENLVNSGSLVAEHGLSLYIETDNRKILFDTGQSGLFLQNAKTLGIAIEEIDYLVLSHGHFDHTGGLYPFLKVNSKAKVYVKRDIFTPKYSDETRFIGTLLNEELLNDRLVFIDEITELDENVFIMPHIPFHHPVDAHFKGFFRKVDNEFSGDEFDDELFMVLKQKNRINIITACSHRGITNICTTATEYFKLPVRLILGGFHMTDCTTEQYIHITHYLRTLQPKSLAVCHCTGIEKYAELYRVCESHLFYNFTGNVIELPISKT
jgi:7,8-dihydropterin-6-yl-methyl-4-(beta-D-ribofuranosyl)aminobenzene 5'-phosphate synthase